MKSKYIYFNKIGSTNKTEIWKILSKSSGFVLGEIRWYGAWRQYCFFPSENCVFNVECMDDIREMIDELMAERRK